MFLKKVKHLIYKSEFNRNVIKLISGSALANVINFLAIPVLSRIYSVEEFGHFQLLFTIITILGVISCLKFEMTLTLAQDKKSSDNLFFGAMIILIGFSTGLYFLTQWMGHELLSIYKADHLLEFVSWVSPAVFSLGLYELLNYVYMRQKAFGKMAKFRIIQVMLIQGSAILMGVLYGGFEKLILSFILGNLIVSVLMILQSNISLSNFNAHVMKKSLIRFRKFPTVNMPMALVNSFSMQLPVFLLSTYFSSEIVGFYMMANRILTTPMQLISRSVGRVYYKEASDAISSNTTKLKRIFLNTVRQVGKIGLIPTIGVVGFAPYFVTLFLGKEWELAGTFMQIMIPFIYFQFVNLPVSTTFSIINRQEIGFLLIIISILLRYFAMSTWHETPIEQITALSIAASLFYISYIYSSFQLLRKKA